MEQQQMQQQIQQQQHIQLQQQQQQQMARFQLQQQQMQAAAAAAGANGSGTASTNPTAAATATAQRSGVKPPLTIPASLPREDSKLERRKLEAILGPKMDDYMTVVSMFLRARLSKYEFDLILPELLGRHNIPLHNRFMMAILHNARSNELPAMNLPIDVVIAIHQTLALHPIPAPAAPVPTLAALITAPTNALPPAFPLTARTQPRRRVIPLPPYAMMGSNSASTPNAAAVAALAGGSGATTRITFRPRTAPVTNPNLPAGSMAAYHRSRRAAKFAPTRGAGSGGGASAAFGRFDDDNKTKYPARAPLTSSSSAAAQQKKLKPRKADDDSPPSRVATRGKLNPKKGKSEEQAAAARDAATRQQQLQQQQHLLRQYGGAAAAAAAAGGQFFNPAAAAAAAAAAANGLYFDSRGVVPIVPPLPPLPPIPMPLASANGSTAQQLALQQQQQMQLHAQLQMARSGGGGIAPAGGGALRPSHGGKGAAKGGTAGKSAGKSAGKRSGKKVPAGKAAGKAAGKNSSKSAAAAAAAATNAAIAAAIASPAVVVSGLGTIAPAAPSAATSFAVPPVISAPNSASSAWRAHQSMSHAVTPAAFAARHRAVAAYYGTQLIPETVLSGAGVSDRKATGELRPTSAPARTRARAPDEADADTEADDSADDASAHEPGPTASLALPFTTDRHSLPDAAFIRHKLSARGREYNLRVADAAVTALSQATAQHMRRLIEATLATARRRTATATTAATATTSAAASSAEALRSALLSRIAGISSRHRPAITAEHLRSALIAEPHLYGYNPLTIEKIVPGSSP